MANKLIYGVGTNNTPYGKGYLAKINNKITREYDHWRRMMQRSYDAKWKEKHPTYEQCSVCPTWHDYQGFGEWYHNNKYRVSTWDLDKDLLVAGNKLYSPETCCFIPEEINKAIIIDGSVSRWHKRDGVFEFVCNGIYLGRANNPTKLADAWLETKLNRINSLAQKYKEHLDPRALDALSMFKIGVNQNGGVYRER